MQPTNQPTNPQIQPTEIIPNYPAKQTNKHPTNQPINLTTYQLINQLAAKQTNQPTLQPYQLTNQATISYRQIKQPTNKLTNSRTNKLTNHYTDQSPTD